MINASSLMNNDGEALPRLKAALLSLTLLALAGCASLPMVEPPDPTQADDKGQVRRFEGVTPERVLAAAETVLRKHRPEASFSQQGDALAMDYAWQGFYVLAAGYERERWVVRVRTLGDVTAASVAMGYASEGYVGLFGGQGVVYPHPTGAYGGWVDIDYGMFWKRLQSVLQGAPWPDCGERRWEGGYRFYEPLCGHATLNRSTPR